MDNLLSGTYTTSGGVSFISVWAIFLALVAIFMLFIMGTAIKEYGDGRLKEFPLAWTLIRIAVLLIIVGFIVGWISPDLNLSLIHI